MPMTTTSAGSLDDPSYQYTSYLPSDPFAFLLQTGDSASTDQLLTSYRAQS
jgi:hypothetical protein